MNIEKGWRKHVKKNTIFDYGIFPGSHDPERDCIHGLSGVWLETGVLTMTLDKKLTVIGILGFVSGVVIYIMVHYVL